MRTSRDFIERSHQIEKMVSPREIFKVYECVFLPYFECGCYWNLAASWLNFSFCKMRVIWYLGDMAVRIK